MQQILDKLKTIRESQISSLDLNEKSYNPWTQQEETLAQTLVDIRCKELERKKILVEIQLSEINSELRHLTDFQKIS